MFRSLIRWSTRRRPRQTAPRRPSGWQPLELLEGRVLPAPFVVMSAADSGPNTLRAAITSANANPGLDTISFQIPGAGLQPIALLSALPTITDPVIIDATTQPGYAGSPLVQLDGTSAGNTANGLFITGGGSTVKGLGIVHFGSYGILLRTLGNNVIVANTIGTDPTGTQPLGNGFDGIHIGVGSSGNQVGGPGALANVIAFNANSGVGVFGATTLANSIRGNSIHDNIGLGIDLTNDGVTGNNPGNMDTGPNNFQNYPAILTASPGSSTSVSGTLNSKPNTTFTLDFYASPHPSVSFYGEGQRYLGSTMVTTDAGGNIGFAATLPVATGIGDWLSATATDPSGNTSEFSAAQRLPAVPAALTSATWTEIGPSPVAASTFFGQGNAGHGDAASNGLVNSGRVDGAASDPTNPNVMVLAADFGGVWKTTDWLDPSPAWTPTSDALPSLDFTGTSYHDLVTAPTDHSRLYADVDGPGGGVLRSTDGGASWTLFNDGGQFDNGASMGSIAVSPTDANTLYVCVWNSAIAGGVYKSSDGGQSWTNTTAGIAGVRTATDVAIDPTNPSVIYAGMVGGASTSSARGVYRSTNGGQTWTPLTTGVLSGANVGSAIRLAIAPSDHQTVYASIFDRTITPSPLPRHFKTTNGGAAWTELAALPDPGEYRNWHMVLSVDPNNSQTVYVNGDHTLDQSTDGGTTWTTIYSEDPVGVTFDATGALVLVGDRGIYRWTKTPGAIFANKQGNLANGTLATITPDPTNPHIIYSAAQDQLTSLKFNGYPVWNAMATNTDEVGKFQVSTSNPSRVYFYDPLATSSFILRSDDGGATFVDSGTGVPTTLNGFNLAYASQHAFAIRPGASSATDELVVGTNQVYESLDGAGTWTAISPVLSPSGNLSDQYLYAVAIAPSQGSTLYAATADGRLWLTTNGGQTAWQERDTGLPVNSGNAVVCIRVDPQNSQHVYAVTNGAGSANHVWATMNGGTSWTNVTGNLPVNDWLNTLAVDWRFSTPVLYAGSIRGVFRSADGGATWARPAAGMPNVQVTDLELEPQFNLLVAGTYGRGVYELTPTTLADTSPTTSYPVIAGADSGSRVLATFTDVVSTETASNFAATSVDWGDQITTAATVSGSNGAFQVSGHHIYAAPGTYPVTVTIRDANGSILASGRVQFVATASTWSAADVTVGSDGQARVLWAQAGGSADTWSVDNSQHASAGPVYGAYSGWTARATAAGADGVTRLLWTKTDGTAALWLEDASGTFQKAGYFGPFTGWTAQDVTVGSDGLTRLLWTNTSGQMVLWKVDGAFAVTSGPVYGPFTGWSVQALAAGTDGLTRILWDNTNGAAALWVLDASGTLTGSQVYGPIAGWSAADLTLASDGQVRLLWTSTGGQTVVWKIDASFGVTSGPVYGPIPGWSAARIEAGADGLIRLLWRNTNGAAALWLLNPDSTFTTAGVFGPF